MRVAEGVITVEHKSVQPLQLPISPRQRVLCMCFVWFKYGDILLQLALFQYSPAIDVSMQFCIFIFHSAITYDFFPLSLSLFMQLVPGLSIIIFSGSYWCKIVGLLIDSFKSCKETYCFKFRVRAKEGPVCSKETKLHLPKCHSKPGMRLRVRKCTVKYRNI